MSVLNLRKQPARSPAREALAGAVNEMTGLLRVAQVARNNLSRAEDLRDQCRARLEAAIMAATVARASHADAMVRSAETGEGFAIASTNREARYAEIDAREDLAAAERAVETMTARTEQPERDLRESVMQARACAKAVIAEQAEAAVAEMDRVFAIMARQRSAVRAIKQHVDRDHPMAERLRDFVYYEYPGIKTEWPAVEAEWAAAFDALLTNPDAALPLITANFASPGAQGAA